MNRVLVVGLDGAEPSLVEPWMELGLLPNLAALRDRGAYLHLRSTVPPATFPAWTTCVTGVNPGRHGVFDFTEMVPDSYRIRFVNATFRKAPALWNILSQAGKRVGILGVPATHPPEPVNGFMVSGFDSPVATRIDRSFVYPPRLFDAVRAWRFADFDESRVREGWHATALQRLLTKIGDKQQIAQDLMAREPWDFFMVVFSESDTVAHHFWLFHDAQSPRHRPGPANAILDVYRRLDTALGKLVEAAGPDVAVFVVSDHGFGGAGTGVVHLNNWLAVKGHLRFSGEGRAWLKKAALSCTPQGWRGSLFRRFKGLAERTESISRTAGIDWAHTTAWSEELNYFPSIRVNLEGREPAGQVPESQYDVFCESLCRELEEWPPVARAWRRSCLYAGEHVGRAPDIIIEFALEGGYSYSCLRSRGGPPFRRIHPSECFGGKEKGMTGNHRPAGVLFLSRKTPAGTASIEDVAPTILAEMGVPGPPMDGTSLLAPMAAGDIIPSSTERPYSAAQERVVEERLRQLGYFE